MTELIYKYYPARWGRDALYRERLKVTTLADINDPFEFLATSRKKELREEAGKLRNTEFCSEGVISFSRTWHEPLLWSHYSDNHKGIALGFELDDPMVSFSMEYKDERVSFDETIAPNMLSRLDFWRKIRIRKYSAWKYEQETRVFPSLNGSISENGIYFRPFEDIGKLRRVILGAEYNSIDDKGLNARLRENKVEVSTARLGFQKFRVEEQKRQNFKRSYS